MKYFGTDGIRGKYADFAVSEPFYKLLGKVVGEKLLADGGGKIVVGGDTRASTESLKAAFCAGLKACGCPHEDVGILPTPALAYAVLKRGAKMGAMITASHNPYTDNGIKFFDENAAKISDQTQAILEESIDAEREGLDFSSYAGVDFSPRPIFPGEFALCEYAEKMSSIFKPGFLSGIKIALDTANGATSAVSARVFRNYGAEVFETGNTPDGFNINDAVGSQHPESLLALCRRVGADVGFAHDGDGDRVIVADENCSLLEGEEVLGLMAVDAAERGKLDGGGIVTTVQSNMGLDESLAEAGISVWRSGVGDRLVAQLMREKGCCIGGENSGHYIFSEISPCGDGLAAALSILSVMVSKGGKLSRLRGGIRMLPVESCAIEVARKIPLEETAELKKAVEECNKALSGKGRILVRYSGTENKIRLLVEGRDSRVVGDCMKKLKNAVQIDLQ